MKHPNREEIARELAEGLIEDIALDNDAYHAEFPDSQEPFMPLDQDARDKFTEILMRIMEERQQTQLVKAAHASSSEKFRMAYSDKVRNATVRQGQPSSRSRVLEASPTRTHGRHATSGRFVLRRRDVTIEQKMYAKPNKTTLVYYEGAVLDRHLEDNKKTQKRTLLAPNVKGVRPLPFRKRLGNKS